jgi:hypothetical protein
MTRRTLLSVISLLLVLVTAASTLGSCRRKERTDWRVRSMLGGRANVLAVSSPTEVRAFRLEDAGAPSDVGPYKIVGPSLAVDEAVGKRLSAIVMSDDTYDWQRVKKTAWTPKVGLAFLRHGVRVDLAVCLDSDQIVVFRGGMFIYCEDTDAARPDWLAALRDALPDDAYLASLTP